MLSQLLARWHKPDHYLVFVLPGTDAQLCAWVPPTQGIPLDVWKDMRQRLLVFLLETAGYNCFRRSTQKSLPFFVMHDLFATL